MEWHDKRALRKRNQIVEAAQSLFFQNGIDGVTIEQIANAAKASRVTIFKYFGDKDSLVRECVRAWVLLMLRGLDGLLESGITFREKLASIISSFSSLRDNTVYQDVRGDKKLLTYVHEVIKAEGVQRIMTLISQGKQYGDIDPSLSDEAILLYFSAFQPIISNSEYIKTDRSVQDGLFKMFMKGLLK